MKKYFWVRMVLALLVLVGVSAVAVEAATVSGTITNNSGKTGRVYLSLQWSGGGETGFGRSIASGGTSYAIRGVQNNGTYVIKAFMDASDEGIQHANEPVGTSASFTISNGADVSNVSVTLNNPSVVSLAAPQLVGAVPGNGGALIYWDPATDSNWREIATSYKVYWSTSPNPGPLNMTGGGSSPALASSDSSAYFRAFTNSPPALYFAVTATLNAVESTLANANGGNPVTIGSPTGGVTVSGTVTTSGVTPGASTPLYIALMDAAADTAPGYIARVASPTASQAYSVTGVPPGSYRVFVILDMNNNGSIDVGDIQNPDPGLLITVGSTNLTGANVALVASNAQITLGTKHWKSFNADWYGLNIEVQPALKRPVNIAVTGPNLVGPIDMGLNSWGGFGIWPDLSARPVLNDTYSFEIFYSDGTSTGASPLTKAVSVVLDSFAMPVSPVGYVPHPYSSGDFSWSAPASPPPGGYTYSFSLSVPGFNFDQYNNMPSSTTSVPYYSYSYAETGQYNWQISVNDTLGNSAVSQILFIPTTSPGINSFSPTSGVPGNQVVITGVNFGATPANNQVRFNGVLATITAASSTSLTVIVPQASTGYITVTNLTTGKSGTSPLPFTIHPPPTTTANPTGGTKSAPVAVYLTANQAATIYYTTNGADPTISSASFVDSIGGLQKGPINISSNTTLKFFAVGIPGNIEAVKTEVYFFGTPTTLGIGVSSSSITYGDSVTATATLTSGAGPTGTVQFYLNGGTYGSPVTLSGTTAALVISGLPVTGSPHSITATYNGDGTYASSTTTTAATVNVAKATITLTLSGTSQTYDSAPKPVTVTLSNPSVTGLIVTYNGSTIVPTSAGSYAVIASLTNANYQAINATGTLVVSPANQTITFGALGGKTFGDAPFTVSATATSGLPVSFSVLSGPATISGSTVTITGGGTVVVRASQAGNANYNAAANVDQSFTVSPANQTITFGALAGKIYGNPAFTVSATATSGLPVSFSILSGPATISGSTVTITGAGTVVVRASQAGNANYNAAANVDQSFVVAKANQTITLTPATLTDKTVGDAPFSVTASADSSLPVTVSILSGPATYNTPNITLGTPTSSNYTVTIQATQAGDANYNSATTSTSFKLLQYGDINSDGTLNLTDVLQYLQVSLHQLPQSSYLGNVLLAPLVNGLPTPGSRTKADIRDASLALEKYVGNW